MKSLISLAAAGLLASAAAVSAQPVQTAVLGDSGNPAYPLQVQASNGVLYHCEAELTSLNGQTARECIRPGGDLFAAGNGIAVAGAVAAGALLILAIADDDDDDTTTTTTAPNT